MLNVVRWGKAKQSADRLTKDYRTPPIPALEIAERRGVNVVFAEFNEFRDDVSGYCDFVNKRLYVNAEDRIQRQNFTIAHELGHWILHREDFERDPGRYQFLPRFTEPDQSDAFEKEANQFAANLLVPEKLLRPVIRLPPSRLADMFQVSKLMMEWRVKNVARRSA